VYDRERDDSKGMCSGQVVVECGMSRLKLFLGLCGFLGFDKVYWMEAVLVLYSMWDGRGK
jgi:hypothetical protein